MSSRSWTRGATRSSRQSEARVHDAIRQAREFVPGYATGEPVSTGDVRLLAAGVQLAIHRATEEMDAPAVLLPPWNGRYRLIMASWVPPLAARHITLHEIGHVLMGDIDEPTIMIFEGPLPEAEDQCDMFSLLGLLDDVELTQGPEFLETRIRELVPLDDYGWQTYRIPRVAARLGRWSADNSPDSGS